MFILKLLVESFAKGKSHYKLFSQNLPKSLKKPNFKNSSGRSVLDVNPLSTNPTKRSNTLKQFVGKLPTNCLSVFDHFVGLALKGLIYSSYKNRVTSLRSSCAGALQKCFSVRFCKHYRKVPVVVAGKYEETLWQKGF